MIGERTNIKNLILDYVSNHESVDVSSLVSDLGVKITTARQYISQLTKEGRLARSAVGQYKLTGKQIFKYSLPESLVQLNKDIKELLPFSDLCIYDGSVFAPLQHHLSINNAVYVETSRDSVDTVFTLLKESHTNVFKQPDADFLYDYINLKDKCFIVKTFVTESPVIKTGGINSPSLEKLLVDIQKDEDFDYLRGTELLYIYQTAFDLYVVNIPKMLRYARRRGAFDSVSKIIEQAQSYD